MSETTDGLVARIAVLEGLVGATLALYMANVGNDPDYSKAHAFIDGLRQDIRQGIAHLPEHMRKDGEAYLDVLLKRVSAGLPTMRGEKSGPSH